MTAIKEPSADNLQFLDPSKDDLNYDWAQWMSWDEPNPTTTARGRESITSNASLFSQAPTCPIDGSASECNPFDYTFDPRANSARGRLPILPSGLPAAGVTPAGLSKFAGSVSPPSASSFNRKRKSSSDVDASGSAEDSHTDPKRLPAKKRSHNVIEKRYRANLNEKIAELRDSVPSLRTANKHLGSSPHCDDDDGQEISPASKLNKASILSKATEYIHHLELRNKRLDEENMALKAHLRQLDKALEQGVTSTGSVSSASPSNTTESGLSSSPSVFSHAEETVPESTSSALYPPEGLIKVPDYMKQMMASSSQQPHYADSYMQSPRPVDNSPVKEGGRRRGYFPNKYMVGAIAGLMVVEGLGTQKTDSDDKGLLALPLEYLHNSVTPNLRYVKAFALHFWRMRALSGALLTAVFVVACAFFVFVYLFNASPRRQRLPTNPKNTHSALPVAPLEFRRQAWLTCVQSIGVPSHTFFPEWFAVTSRCFDYCFRCILGWSLYSWLTGVTEDDERGRVKTWDIAIDAQLTGGDAEISKSRLVLTIFAAGTLPRSPARMMMKAMHCRILLWMVGSPDSWSFKVSNDVARALARYQWGMARKMQGSLAPDHPEALPPHLAALLDLDCDEVMVDSIVQRAANMTWNRPTQEATDDEQGLLDVVAEDPAIRSPLEALGAWWSSYNLQTALLSSLEAQKSNQKRRMFEDKLDAALRTAPPNCSAYTRAVATRAVFFKTDRAANITSALAALPSSKDYAATSPMFVDSSIPASIRTEIEIAVRCAIIAEILDSCPEGDSSPATAMKLEKVASMFKHLPVDPVELTLLGFTSIYHLLHVLAAEGSALTTSPPSSPGSSASTSPSSSRSPSPSSSSDTVQTDKHARGRHGPTSRSSDTQFGRIASGLLYWARNAYNPVSYGFTTDLVDQVEKDCVNVCRTVGVEIGPERAKRGRQTRRGNGRKKHRSLPSVEEQSEEPSGRRVSRCSSVSNDTGYASLGQEGEEEQACT